MLNVAILYITVKIVKDGYTKVAYIYIFLLLYICYNNFILQLLDRVDKSAEERAVAANVTVSDHDVEIEHYSNYLKAQMKKIDSSKWMDFTMDTMGLVRRYVCGDKQASPPPPSPPSPPINVVDDRQEIIHPTPINTLTSLNVVQPTSTQNLSSYLASIATPSLSQPMYSDFLSPRMALMGSPSLPAHLMRPDMALPPAERLIHT